MGNSEKFTEIKRGRKEHPLKSQIASLYNDKGERSVNNKMHMGATYAACGWDLGKDSAPYSWLFELTPNGNFKRGTLIAELGRFEDEETIRTFAAALCEGKPKVKTALHRMRAIRLTGKPTKAGSVLELQLFLFRCMDEYLEKHTISNDEILEAFRRVCAELEDEGGDE